VAVPRYWIVDRDKSNTVQMYRLSQTGYEPEREPLSLAWLLNGLVPALD
jgi:Uma2 family endonuclease